MKSKKSAIRAAGVTGARDIARPAKDPRGPASEARVHGSMRADAAAFAGEIDSAVASLEPLLRELEELRDRGRALGLFVDDRELLTCPKCGLMEDVLSDGTLVTVDALDGADTGLRFVPTAAEDTFTCPRCRVEARSG